MSSGPFDLAVIGGGAAGLMCAMTAGRRGRRTVVIEHNSQIGRKILISGGGRCNFTNIRTAPENFISENPDFCRSALARYRPEQFITLVEKHRIEYYEKTLGQLFCRGSAREITGMLERECREHGVQFALGTALATLEPGSPFRLGTSAGEIRASAVVVASGGLSIPKIGASGFGYKLAERFGHRIIALEPALVPLIWSGPDLTTLGTLSGVSLPVTIAIAGGGGRPRFEEKLLFTHRGVSGPAVLQISSYWRPGESLEIDLAPHTAVGEELKQRKARGERAELKTALALHLPRRFAEVWTAERGGSRPLSELSDRHIREVDSALHRWSVAPAGTEGFGKAEVTRGGVDTREISSKTFESSRVEGLYFIGEVLDVTGHLGGYNFQWAWASGFACGEAV